ncbi:MAG: tyrosine-type recombinase/integrase [Deltaproteobacteria bacterium]|nr:tyrosine-type recombinase/integrase [Deltaproteobacteria bacterium]MBW2663225.1 tyrosine-type recombinase/integrase [Deltaproteobacteria bacterium]
MVKRLEKAVSDYLLWMISNGYADSTSMRYQQVLKHFAHYIIQRAIPWDAVFTFDTLKDFQKESGLILALRAVRGLSRYLFKQNRIKRLIEKPVQPLPEVFEEYLDYYTRVKDISRLQMLRARRTLTAFGDYFDKNSIMLKSVRIEQIDAFLAEYNRNYTKEICGTNRSILRGFLAWLHQNRILKRNFAPLIIGAPVFAQSKPPKFLRPNEIRCLFESLTGTTPIELRTTAIVHLGFYLGLRPKEISRIRLDDIEFKKQEICIPDRKNTNPARLPLPDRCIKTVAAYIMGCRPATDNRKLFITVRVPYRPLLPVTVSKDIAGAMTKAGLSSTAYWLRHTYAQNLLEADVPFFEIKEMMGHDSIQTTRRYLHVHTKLMREVLFDDESF